MQDSTGRNRMLMLVAACLLAHARVYLVSGDYFDDPAWLMSAYASHDVSEFLDTGFRELRRPLMGVFLYGFFMLHKILPTMAYAIWDSIVLGLTLGSAMLLYRLVRALGGESQTDAAAITAALAFILVPLDTTLPVHVHVNYRSGVFLSLASFCLTIEAIRREDYRYRLSGAVLCSICASYVMIEGAVAYEPARLLMIAAALWRIHGGRWRLVARRAALIFTPFVLLALPLVAYKLIYKPYGAYAGFYDTGPSNITPGLLNDLGATMLWHNGFSLLRHAGGHASAATYVMAIAALVLAVTISVRYHLGQISSRSDIISVRYHRTASTGESDSAGMGMLVLGLLMLILPAVLYLLAGKAPAPAEESRHAIILQPGYSLMLGGLAAMAAPRGGAATNLVRVLIPIVIALTVFIHNLNLDLYGRIRQERREFWQAFTMRFPSLPKRAVFLMDYKPGYPHYGLMDLFYHYQFEYELNLLYATSEEPSGFRRYRVMPMNMNVLSWLRSGRPTYKVRSYWGEDVFSLDELIIVRHREGKIYVNGEIAVVKPDIVYRQWLDRAGSPSQSPAPEYIYRSRAVIPEG